MKKTYELYKICSPETEGAELLPLNYDSNKEKISIVKTELSSAEYVALMEKAARYSVIKFGFGEYLGKETRDITPNEAIFADGELYGIRAIYHDSGEWTEGAPTYTVEPFTVPFVLQKCANGAYVKDSIYLCQIIEK